MINLCRSRRFMKILAFTVMSRLRRRTPGYKFRKVHVKIPPGRTQRTSTSTYGSLASLLSLPPFFSSLRTETSVQSSLYHMLRDINGREKGNEGRHSQNVSWKTGRIKIMSLISRSSLAINGPRGEVFVGEVFIIHAVLSPADVMARYY